MLRAFFIRGLFESDIDLFACLSNIFFVFLLKEKLPNGVTIMQVEESDY